MTATFRRIVIAAVAFIAVAGIAAGAVMSGGCSTDAAPLDGARNGAVNAVLDLSGVKGRVDAKLREKAGELASEVGVSQAVVDNVVDSLAIEDWQATTLPADAVETGTYAIDAGDVSATVTTYDDPAVVTVEAYGQTVTMAVPDSAQGYLPFVKYLERLR